MEAENAIRDALEGIPKLAACWIAAVAVEHLPTQRHFLVAYKVRPLLLSFPTAKRMQEVWQALAERLRLHGSIYLICLQHNDHVSLARAVRRLSVRDYASAR